MSTKINFTIGNKTKKKTPSSSSQAQPLSRISFENNKSTSSTTDRSSLSSLSQNNKPLIIPLPTKLSSSTTTNKPLLSNADRDAINALTDDAAKFRHDIERRPDPIDFTSDDIAGDDNGHPNGHVPVSSFGAAMLRGMGWDGTNEEGGGDIGKPRHYRLGLGAVPKMEDLDEEKRKRRSKKMMVGDEDEEERAGGYRNGRYWSSKKRPRRDDNNDDNKSSSQPVETEEEQVTKRQTALVVGSIVRINDGTTRRARVVKTLGVPGLNQILIEWEAGGETAGGDGQTITSVSKESLSLVDVEEVMSRNPFRELTDDSKRKVDELTVKKRRSDETDDNKKSDHSNDHTQERDKYYRDKRSGDRNHHKHGRDRDRDRNKHDDIHPREKRRDRYSDRDRNNDRHHNDKTKTSPTWVIPHIRVRIISPNHPRFKQKGIILQVVNRSRSSSSRSTVTPHCQIQMDDDGVILDDIPQRYLETALPKTGGVVMWLAKRQKGRLLDRRRGMVQLLESLEGVEVDLDDLAEWCGDVEWDE